MKRCSMRVFLLPSILIVFGVLSACTTTRSVKNDDFATYTHESPAFTVKYPESWVERQPSDCEVLSVGPTFSPKDLPLMSVFVFKIPEGYKLSEVPEETVKQSKRLMPWASNIKKKTKDIKLNDGTTAIATTYSWKWKGRPVHFDAFQVAAIKDNNLVYTFTVDARFQSYHKSLKRYAESLEFLVPEITESHGVENVLEEAGGYYNNKGEEKKRSNEVKETATEKNPAEPVIQISMPLSKMTSHDLKGVLVSANTRKKMVYGTPTPDGKVEVQGVLMKKRAIQLCEIIEDVEALEKYEPEYVSDLPDTGFVVQNDTNGRVTMKITGLADKTLAVPAGETAAVALPEGAYEYSFSSDNKGSLKNFSGEKNILKKCRYLFKFYLRD